MQLQYFRDVNFQDMNLLIWLTLLTAATASPGDKLKRFKRCVRECNTINCDGSAKPSEWSFDPFNQNLQYLYWTCQNDCDYQCQRIITAERKQAHRKPLQFHGKWAFRRLFGVQELASTVFSLGNLVPHLLASARIARHWKKSEDYRQSTQLAVILAGCLVTCCAWMFSTIFHIRDVKTTEHLDYYFAGLTVLMGLYNVTVRVFDLYGPENASTLGSVTALFVALYTGHIYRLVTDWLYTYNMQANITIAVLQNVLMGVLVYKLYSKYYDVTTATLTHLKYTDRVLLPSFFTRSDKLYSLYPVLLAVIVIGGIMLEIFDFSPFGDLVDAHSLWHLVTIVPVVYGWYDWLVWDAETNLT